MKRHSSPRGEPFPPPVEDVYYSPEETAALSLPRVVELRKMYATVADETRGEYRLSIGESRNGWRLLAITRAPRTAVLERRFACWGMIAYVGRQGPVLKVRLPVGQLTEAVAEPPEWPDEYIETILQSNRDLLGEQVLSQGEPRFEACVGLLPELVGYVPLSSESSARKAVVDAQGRIGFLGQDYGRKEINEVLFDPAALVGGWSPKAAKRGLLGGYLPAIHYAFWDEEAQDGWEQIAFALPGKHERILAALLHRGERRYFALEPLRELKDPGEFFEALSAFCGYWQRELSTGMRVNLPEMRLEDASLAGIARSFTTFLPEHPKYGLGHYAAEQHDGFPPTILWMVNTCLEWGFFDRARTYLSYYFDHFVADDGTFKYYGPAVSEYGQMLECVARYVRYTGDGKWLTTHGGKVKAIARHLLSLRAESLNQPRAAVTRGLLFGSPEADTRKETNYYFSSSAWAYRGLLELSRLYNAQGRDAAFAQQLAAEAAAVRTDLLRAARAALIPGNPAFLPPFPGVETPFRTMTADRLASYTNYRYWPELLAAEVLDDELAEAVFEYRRQMGGELLATTRFSGHLDDWPFALQARALLQDDRIDQFLLGLYGHLALHQMPGTFCAYEQVMIRGTDHRTYQADYCVPAQLTIPLLVRWMLVFEERDADILWLCKAVPRRWLSSGKTFSVRNAPTRWGPVSFQISARQDSVEITVIPPPRGVETLMIRIRRPNGLSPTRIADGGAEVTFDRETETLALHYAQAAVRLRVEYH